jgi:hypothetical protein
MAFCKALFAVAVAMSLLLPATALAAPSADRPARAKIKVHPKRLWHGYGYLPGYRPAMNNLDRYGRNVRTVRPEPRYLNWHRTSSVRLGLSGILSRALERWQLRSVLDLDADRHDADVRAVSFADVREITFDARRRRNDSSPLWGGSSRAKRVTGWGGRSIETQSPPSSRSLSLRAIHPPHKGEG